MKIKCIQLIIATFFLVWTGSTQAQSFGEKLGKSIKNAAERSALRKAEQKTDEAVSKTIDKITDPNSYKSKDKNKDKNQQSNSESESREQSSEQSSTDNSNSGKDSKKEDAPANSPKAIEMLYSKSDFVSGDEIIFEDNLVGEKLGEFPSMWDMLNGNIEISKMNGENVIAMFKSASTTPLMKTPKNYLPESFTIELDVYIGGLERNDTYINGNYRFEINGENSTVARIFFWGYALDEKLDVAVDLRTTNGEYRDIRDNVPNIKEGWHHLAISFNKRALKVYVDGYRVANAPNVAQGKWFSIESGQNGGQEATFWFKNIRIAKGAVPLYDRMMTDGKFITYGITFDIGKSTIKPESMGEINRIVKLMTENPDLKFSVEGHTDNTGNAASNQTLSEARSQAIVTKLIEMGIATNRLSSSGKGQSNPIADNSTDEGRAKNRRVEFVKQ